MVFQGEKDLQITPPVAQTPGGVLFPRPVNSYDLLGPNGQPIKKPKKIVREK